MALCGITHKAEMARRSEVIGAILAGGSGARMGGSKATVGLYGRPLVSYPVEAVWRALGNAVVVAKPDTELPSLPGVTVWIEPEEPRHPLVGLAHALAMAEGRAVVVCAADLPFVTPALIRRLARGGRGSAVIAAAGGRSQPLLGWYHPRALPVLQELDVAAGISLHDAVGNLEPALLEVEDPDLLFNVNTPSDLLQAAAMIDRFTAQARGT